MNTDAQPEVNKDAEAEINEDSMPVGNEDLKPVVNEESKDEKLEDAKIEVNEDAKPEVNEEQQSEVNEDTKPEVNGDAKHEVNEDAQPIVQEDTQPELNRDPLAEADAFFKQADTDGNGSLDFSEWSAATIYKYQKETLPELNQDVQPVEPNENAYVIPTQFKLLTFGDVGEPGWRLGSRKDLEANPTMKNQIVNSLDVWEIVLLANEGKLDGPGYGGGIHDSHGTECCSMVLWVI